MLEMSPKEYICSCFFKRNIFVKKYKIHVVFENETQFEQEYRQVGWIINALNLFLKLLYTRCGKMGKMMVEKKTGLTTLKNGQDAVFFTFVSIKEDREQRNTLITKASIVTPL